MIKEVKKEMYENIPKINLYAFNIICEAKVRTLIDMTKQFHPDWTNGQIEQFLKNAVEVLVKKKLG